MNARRQVILTGAQGFIGRALTRRLEERGYSVVPLRSRTSGPQGMNIATGWIDREALEGAHAVINLAGAPISTRWTKRRKQAITASRVDGTQLLASTLAGLSHKPAIFLSMSGISRYGIHREGFLDEDSPVCEAGFLGKLSAEWEKATAPAQAAGIRTTVLRCGVVLAASGGALKLMLPAFRLGLGGRMSNGQQKLSWIRLGDLVELMIWCLENPSCPPVINVTAPGVVSQGEFAHALARQLHRPCLFPTPAWVIRLIFGQMGVETVLSDLHVEPLAAVKAGFKFATPTLESALPLALGE
jgi:uncharacterized protein (TIGR01777 family)